MLFGGRPAYTEIEPKLAAERLSRYMIRIFPELAGVEHSAVEPDAVDRAKDLIERAGGEDPGGLVREPVRLAELDPGQDAQAGEPGAAALY